MRPVRLHLQGDASSDELAMDVKLDFSGQSFAAVVLANRQELFIRFLNRWYGDRDLKLPEQSEKERDRIEQDFGTPEGLRARISTTSSPAPSWPGPSSTASRPGSFAVR